MSLRVVTLLVAGSSVLGCSGTDVDDGTYVARLSASDAWVSVVVEGETAVAFSCGGAKSLKQNTRWMAGTVEDGRIVFARDGWALDVESDDVGLTGALTSPQGERLSVEAEVVLEEDPLDGLAGLFSAVVDGCRAGAIIDDDGSVRGAFCTEATGFVSQVTPVMPVQQTADGISVEAVGPDGVMSFAVRPVNVASVVAEVTAEGG